MHNTRQTFAELCKQDLYHGTVPRCQTRGYKFGITAILKFIYRLTNFDSVLCFVFNSEWPLVLGMRDRYEDGCPIELYVRPNQVNFRGPLAAKSEENRSYICYVERWGPEELLG